MNKVMKALLAVSGLALMLAASGCKVSGGVVVIPPSQPHYPPHQTYCWYDSWGYMHCDRYVRNGNRFAEVKDGNEYFYTTSDERVAAVSKKYEISHYAATYIVRAVVMADQKDMTGVNEIGLTEDDLKMVYEGKMLSNDKVKVVAEKLMMKHSEANRVVAKMAAEFRAANK